jgi:hypothetical protein
MFFGVTIGILVAIMTNTYWYSTTHFFKSLTPILVDVIAAALTVGFIGGVIGWVIGYKGIICEFSGIQKFVFILFCSTKDSNLLNYQHQIIFLRD